MEILSLLRINLADRRCGAKSTDIFIARHDGAGDFDSTISYSTTDSCTERNTIKTGNTLTESGHLHSHRHQLEPPSNRSMSPASPNPPASPNVQPRQRKSPPHSAQSTRSNISTRSNDSTQSNDSTWSGSSLASIRSHTPEEDSGEQNTNRSKMVLPTSHTECVSKLPLPGTPLPAAPSKVCIIVIIQVLMK